MVEIENKYLKVKINLDGGSLTSILDKRTNEELLYQKDERSWMGQDVVIFPFVASLKNRIYHHNGKEYSLKNHGLIRYNHLSINEKKENEVTLKFEANEETLLQYPFNFIFKIHYVLIDNKLKVEYIVKNNSNEILPFSLGGHPALKVNGKETEEEFQYENVKILFEKNIKTKQFLLNNEGNLIISTIDVSLPKEIELDKTYIDKYRTLIYDCKDIDKVTLISGDKTFIFDTSKASVLAIWTKKGFGDYLCIEPWWGIPDFENPNLEIKEKPYINFLNPNDLFITYYSIEF